MSNETDLHASTRTPNGTAGRLLVCYYLVLIIVGTIVLSGAVEGGWKLAAMILIVAFALIPPSTAVRDKIKLRNLRRGQLAQHREEND